MGAAIRAAVVAAVVVSNAGITVTVGNTVVGNVAVVIGGTVPANVVPVIVVVGVTEVVARGVWVVNGNGLSRLDIGRAANPSSRKFSARTATGTSDLMINKPEMLAFR